MPPPIVSQRDNVRRIKIKKWKSMLITGQAVHHHFPKDMTNVILSYSRLLNGHDILYELLPTLNKYIDSDDRITITVAPNRILLIEDLYESIDKSIDKQLVLKDSYDGKWAEDDNIVLAQGQIDIQRYLSRYHIFKTLDLEQTLSNRKCCRHHHQEIRKRQFSQNTEFIAVDLTTY